MPFAKISCVLLLSALPSLLWSQAGSLSHEKLLGGTWVLVPERSVFIGRQVPLKQVLIYESREEGLHATIVFTNQDGTEDRISYTASQEGVPTSLQGSENFDSLITDAQGPYRATSSFTHAGRVVGQAERRISLDGKEMTVEVKRYGNLSSRAVFVKQE